MQGLRHADTISVIHDFDGAPAAADLESKMTESGARVIQPADYRNFCHGRHNWLGKHPDNSGVIALISPQSETLAGRILGGLPDEIPVVELRTKHEGVAATLSLLIQSMLAAGALGDQRGIDPGRPGAAHFVGRLHRMGPYEDGDGHIQT